MPNENKVSGCEEYRDVAWWCKEKICISKVQLELKLERTVDDNKKRFFKIY